MRFLILLLLSVSAPAQPLLPFQQRPIALAGLASPNPVLSIPTNIATAFLWYVASDLSDGTVTGWTDRVQRAVAQMVDATKQPSKSGKFVQFTAASNTALTNRTVNSSSWGSDNKHVYVLIVSHPNASATQYIWSFFNSPSIGLSFVNATSLLQSFDSVNNDILVNPMGTALKDVVYQPNQNHNFSWTNGVTANLNNNGTAFSIGGFTGFVIGNSGNGSLNQGLGANVYELIVYTNVTWTATMTSNIHYYATNVYSFTP